jgi:Uma2 family endonuclease
MRKAEMLRRLRMTDWWLRPGEFLVVPLGRPATIADLAITKHKTEIVDGALIVIGPSGGRPCRAAGRIFRSLNDYEVQHGGGYALGSRIAYILDLPHRLAICPDAAWYTCGMWADDDHPRGSPVFAAEVRESGEDGPEFERRSAARRADYFAAGTKVVWDVDVLGGEDVVRVYRADDPEHPTIYRRGEVAEAEPAVPGWRMPVDELFD